MSQEQEISKLKRTIAELQQKAGRSEMLEQNLREARKRLDMQVEKYSRIHKYAINAFGADSSTDFYNMITEGIVDIFELELGGYFGIDWLRNKLVLLGNTNFDCSDLELLLPEDLVLGRGIWNFTEREAVFESPVRSKLWAEMDLAHVVLMPVFDDSHQLGGLLLGGVSNSGVPFYSFTPDDNLAPFMVYCQLMNGLINSRESARRAMETAKSTSRFLADLSHEIRTPMNAIIGMVQLAERTEDMDQLKRYTKQINQSSNHLLGLLNDVLDLSKINEGKLKTNSEVFNLGDLVESVYNSLAPGALAKSLEFKAICEDCADLDLVGDPVRLTQVLLNLLSNSIKFTPHGGQVQLFIERLRVYDTSLDLCFTVQDNGIGMSAEFMEKIFTPYEQADDVSKRKAGGTGLGLVISKNIVELLGGRLNVRSKANEGSNFSFVLSFAYAGPQNREAELAPGAALLPDFHDRRILIVDDIEINREIMRHFLDDFQLDVEEADNGREAVNMFLRSAPGYYDLILMDVIMPQMDGYEAARAIRASVHPDAAGIPIVAITANALADDVKRTAEAGMNTYLSKPVDLQVLQQTVSKYLLEKESATQADKK